MGRSAKRRTGRRDAVPAGLLWTGAAVLAAAGVFVLSTISSSRADPLPDPPFAVFEAEPKEQDELPAWVELDTGRDEVRFLTTSGTGSYYVSRGRGGYCLVVVRTGSGESYSAFPARARSGRETLSPAPPRGLRWTDARVWPSWWLTATWMEQSYPGTRK